MDDLTMSPLEKNLNSLWEEIILANTEEMTDMLTGVQEMQEIIHQNSVAHGFWDKPADSNIMAKLMHIVCEVAEAAEETRILGGDLTIIEWKYPVEIINEDIKLKAETLKPEGFPIELADIMIRVMDLAERYEINLTEAINYKIDFNTTRPYKHDKLS